MKLKYAVRLSADVDQQFAKTMMVIGSILYREAKKEDTLACAPMDSHDMAFVEAERISILGSIIPPDQKEGICKCLFTICMEMVVDVLESIGNFTYSPKPPKSKNKDDHLIYQRKLKLVRESSGYEEREGIWISVDSMDMSPPK